MTKPNLGKKQTCKNCETRFFDMNKSPAVCPKCGEEMKVAKPKAKRSMAPTPDEMPADSPKGEAASPEAVVSDDDDVASVEIDGDLQTDEVDDLEAELEDDQDDDLMEDTSDIGEDNDDMSEVLEHVDDGIEDK